MASALDRWGRPTEAGGGLSPAEAGAAHPTLRLESQRPAGSPLLSKLANCSGGTGRLK